MSDNFDPEENMFNTEFDGNSYEEDDDELASEFADKFSLETDEEEQEETDEEEQEETEKVPSIFDDIDLDKKSEEEDEFSEKELNALNAKLGTDFKTLEELKAGFNKKEEDTEFEKEEQEYQVLSNKIVLFDKYIGMDNEELVRNQLYSSAQKEKKDINDPDVQDEIEEKLQGLADLDQVDSMAETLRSNLQSQKDKTKSAVDVIENKRLEKSNLESKKNTETLQNEFSKIFKEKSFYGVTVSKEDIFEVYEDIRSNKFFDSINNNQEMIVKFAMFAKYEKEISKIANSPTQSDKTKGAFEFLTEASRKSPRSITQAKGSGSSGSAEENVINFTK